MLQYPHPVPQPAFLPIGRVLMKADRRAVGLEVVGREGIRNEAVNPLRILSKHDRSANQSRGPGQGSATHSQQSSSDSPDARRETDG
ncbi:MAG: hypothetical protein EBU09_08350 [Betaproteobacteria bacterium]|nr:hypothetical protein [Betaproteobacteria bacterium]